VVDVHLQIAEEIKKEVYIAQVEQFTELCKNIQRSLLPAIEAWSVQQSSDNY
jgi:hypothetical protein